MSADSAGVRRTRHRTWPILLIGFALIGSVFVGQDLITRYISTSNEQRSRRLERDSFYSIDEVNRISRDALQIQVLVNDHIYENDPAAMVPIEQKINALFLDIDERSRVYESLIEFPDEAAEWEKARASLARLHTTVGAALELSRQNLDDEARARWMASRTESSGLGPSLTALIALNRKKRDERNSRN
jgi:hypothetical protein